MKVFAKILLTFLAMPVFLLLILSINIRFQFLDSEFWTNTFEKGNVYQKISNKIDSSLESSTIGSGGMADDVTSLSSLVSEENIKVFFEENVKSFTEYANGKSSEIMVTFPFSNNIWNLSQKMELTQFLKENNIGTVNKEDLKNISRFGTWSWMATSSLILAIIFIYTLLYLLTDSGKHLISLGLVSLFSGILMVAFFAAGKFGSSIISRDFIESTNLGKSIIAIVSIPVIKAVAVIWFWAGIAAVILGIILFFVKKPVYNQVK